MFQYCVTDGGGFVYLVRDTVTGLYKVGMSTQLYSRLRLLAASSSNELVIVAYTATNNPSFLERDWKREWWDHHVFGEWFRLSEDHANHFRSIKNVRYEIAHPGSTVPDFDPFDLPSTKSVRQAQKLRVGESIKRGRVKKPS